MKTYAWRLMHYLMHGLLICLTIAVFSQGYMSSVAIVLGAMSIILDGLAKALKVGIRNYVYLRSVLENWKYREHFFHTPRVLIIALTLSLLSVSPTTLCLGMFFLSMSLNILLDLAEMKILHGMPLSGWTLKQEHV